MQDAVVNLIRVSLRDHQRFGEAMERRGNQIGRTRAGHDVPLRPGRPERLRHHLAQQQMWRR